MKNLLICLLFFVFCACQSATQPNERAFKIKRQEKLNRAMPWIWACGYLHFEDSISTVSLKQLRNIRFHIKKHKEITP